MANYSYKELASCVKQSIVDDFEERYGRECDWDPNYDGDLHTLSVMTINELEQEIIDLRVELEQARRGG